MDKSNDLPSLQHENQASETFDCRSSTRNLRQPKFEVMELKYLTFFRVAELQHLTFHSEKVFNHYLFSENRSAEKSNQVCYAFVNVHYVNVKHSIFECNWPFKTQLNINN